jgi:hypothetical protein
MDNATLWNLYFRQTVSHRYPKFFLKAMKEW